MWFDTLKTLFVIKDKFSASDKGKQNISKEFISKKVSDLMQEMSENIEFEDIIKVLLEIDPAADYWYTKNWFQQLFISKNDQELLLSSAKRLLSNENSALIDTIVERYNVGFIGSRDKQAWALCGILLGGFVNDWAFILTMWDHKFHSKWFFEELKNRKIAEGKKDADFKPEWPICKRHDIEFEEKKKKPSINERRKRGKEKKTKKESDAQDTEEIQEEGEEQISSHPLMDKRIQLTTIEQYEREYSGMKEALYEQRLSAFDEDFAASQLNFIGD